MSAPHRRVLNFRIACQRAQVAYEKRLARRRNKPAATGEAIPTSQRAKRREQGRKVAAAMFRSTIRPAYAAPEQKMTVPVKVSRRSARERVAGFFRHLMPKNARRFTPRRVGA